MFKLTNVKVLLQFNEFVFQFVSCDDWLIAFFNVILQAKTHIESGDIQGIIDPALGEGYDIQSMWKIAEKALMCVQPHGFMRPSISEVLKDIQDAISIERESAMTREGNSDEMSRNSMHSSLHAGSMDMGGGAENYVSVDETITQPAPR